MSEEVVIGRRYAVVIPKRVRKKLGIKEGQRAVMRTEGGRLILEPLPENPYEVLRQVLGKWSYRERVEERRVERWLTEAARGRH